MTRGTVVRSTVVLVFLAGGLTLLDGFLARTEMSEMHGEAAEAYRRGAVLLNQGKAGEAVAPLRKAWVLERENPGYAVQLGNALARAGKLEEAESLITDALSRQPNDGEANLAAARLMVRKNAFHEAGAHFHRAIYGEWMGNPASRRIAARMELIELLAEQKKPQEMLAELISLDEETSGDIPIRKRLAHFYVVAGSPARAISTYRDLEVKDPGDVEVLAGLGEAELQNGNYHAARNAFLRAGVHNPGSPIESRLQLVDTLASLDPMPRKLTSLEKYRRSRRILGLAQEDLAELTANNTSSETSDTLRRATEILARKEPANVNNEMAEEVLTLVEQIWHLRVQLFGDNFSPKEEPLRLLVQRLAG